MGHTITVIKSHQFQVLWYPRVICSSVFLVFGGRYHLVEKALEWPLLCGWIRTDVICWVSGESLRAYSHLISFQPSICCQAFLISAFCCSMGYLSNWDFDMILMSCLEFPISTHIDVDSRVSFDEVLEVSFRIHTRHCLLHWPKSLEGSHWFRLTMNSARHLFL